MSVVTLAGTSTALEGNQAGAAGTLSAGPAPCPGLPPPLSALLPFASAPLAHPLGLSAASFQPHL